jgi:hypothetical protein
MKATTAMLVTEDWTITGIPMSRLVAVMEALGFKHRGFGRDAPHLKEELQGAPQFDGLYTVGDAPGLIRYESSAIFRTLSL